MANSKKPKTDLELVSLEDLPTPRRPGGDWPYQQWEDEIPPGQAIEITDQLNGRKASTVQSTVKMNASRRGLTIRSMVRNNRIWIYKDKEEKDLS